MESPSPTERRQAWVRSSRHWLALQEEADLQAPHVLPDRHAALEGCSAAKIESWLQTCGSDECLDDSIHQNRESLLKTGASFEDDLSLGAEALVLNTQDDKSEIRGCPLLLPPPRHRNKGQATSTPNQKLSVPLPHLGHSMASSSLSSTASRAASSVSDMLQLCAQDAEETLYQLGFGSDEPQVTARIPARFFSFPSRLRGINFRLFLESQLGRLHQEDPGLSLASRFRQVEVLTAMANAFYSLYSHVTRTPVQKLAPPDTPFSQSPVETRTGTRFFSHARSEPRSPVERLKDTVSKMCLYTGPSLRSPDHTSPHTSPRKRASLPDLVESILETDSSEVIPSLRLKGRFQIKATGQDRKVTWKEPRSHVGYADRNNAETGGKATEVGKKDAQLLTKAPPIQNAASNRSSSSAVHRLCQLIGDPSLSVEKPLSSSHQAAAPHCRPFSGINLLSKFSHSIGAHFPQSEDTQLPSNCGTTLPLGGQAALKEGLACIEENLVVFPPECRLGGTDRCAGRTHPNEAGPLASPPCHSAADDDWPSPCRITVTGWEGDPVSDRSTGTPEVEEVQAGLLQETCSSHCFLKPGEMPGLKQANSFELEEVHSAEEEEPGQAEARCSASPVLLAVSRHRDLLLRGDSLQSDSSGYGEEDHTLPL